RLYAGSEGNPFFTKELVHSLVDSGGIVKDTTGAWTLSAEAGLAADALPPTIQKAVEKRVGRLPDDLRDILAIASVFGPTFDARVLLARAPRLAGDLETALRETSAAARIFEQAHDTTRLLGALVLAAETAWQARQTDEMGRFVTRGLPIARATGDTDSSSSSS